MHSPAFYLSFLLILGVIIHDVTSLTAADERKSKSLAKAPPKVTPTSARPSKRGRKTKGHIPVPKKEPKAAEKMHFGVSMNSLTGYEKPGMPIRVIDFNGTLPLNFNATNHIIDLPWRNNMKILVDPEDVDWSKHAQRP